jgi:hypothetical protein
MSLPTRTRDMDGLTLVMLSGTVLVFLACIRYAVQHGVGLAWRIAFGSAGMIGLSVLFSNVFS